MLSTDCQRWQNSTPQFRLTYFNNVNPCVTEEPEPAVTCQQWMRAGARKPAGWTNPCPAECENWLQLLTRPTFNPCFGIAGWETRMAAIDAERNRPTITTPVMPPSIAVPGTVTIPFLPIALPPSGPNVTTPSMPPQAVTPPAAGGFVSVGGPRLVDVALDNGGVNLPFVPPSNLTPPTTTTHTPAQPPATVKKEPNLLPIALGVFILKLLF